VHDIDNPNAEPHESMTRVEALADFHFHNAGVKSVLPVVWIEEKVYCGYLKSRNSLRQKFSQNQQP
jgi:hypothetical protein